MCAAILRGIAPTGAHVIALASGVFLSGAMFSISAIMIPTLLDTNTEPAGLTKQWARLYHYGSVMMPSMSVAIAAVYGLAWMQYGQSPSEQGMRCLAAGALTMAIAPYTWFAMIPTNNALFAMAASGPDFAGKQDANDKARGLVMKWVILHSIRSIIPLAGAIVGFMGISSE
ncbi:hypothetical protein E4U40_002193 [Claviceps sp. LM458 group G5]|nr:hypothetical protein E4U40_002193 [Claviceps sp. LM458 group G5]